MFVRSTKLDHLLSALFVVTMGACGNFGGCGACGATAPLPQGGLPADQTLEGGAQIRVTPQGFQKLTSILPGVLNQQLGNGFCIPHGTTGYTLGTGADWCDTNNNGCNPGCKVNVALNPGGLGLSVTNQQQLHVTLSTSVSTQVHLSGSIFGIGAVNCTITATSPNLNGDLDIALGITPTTGELNIHVAQINSFQLNMTFGGCSLISDIANLAGDIIDSFLGQFVIQLLTPAIDNLIQGFLPNPLGIAGMIDIGKLLAGISPGTQAEMEARLVPGGYVQLDNGGMSLGMITGINSDRDPSTRTGTRPDGVPYASEPALCVPPLGAPNFGAPPYNLPLTARNTWGMIPADALDGNPDPANTDLAMGISQSTLDQLGHHLVTSGGMCLGVGTTLIKQLNVGTIGVLVPSLADLESSQGNDPLLLVTRPQREVTFKIGDNTTTSPALTVGISHLEVDFYAFLYERYVRAFTLDLSLDVGVNLMFSQQPGMPVMIQPSLVGLSSQNVQLKVLNSDFVKETPQHLEMVLPSVFDLVTQLVNIPPIQMPSFAGFTIENPTVAKISTSQDLFLALTANLGSSAMMRQLATHDIFARDAVMAMDAKLPAVQPASDGTARLVSVTTPSADVITAALEHADGGALPAITFDVDRYDGRGRPLEWTWRIEGGLWHEFTQASPLVISDRAFAWQGKYTVGLKSRVAGDFRTESAEIVTPVVIDSVAPKIFVDEQKWDGDELSVPVFDVVSGHAVDVAFGRPGDVKPETDWMPAEKATLARKSAEELAVDGAITVFARDEVGNISKQAVQPFHGQAGAGCSSCEAGGRPGAGSLMLLGVVAFALRRRRGSLRRLRRAAFVVGAGVLSALMPGCSCHNAAKACETMADCGKDSCPMGQLPFCVDNTCVCSDDIPPGKIGPYSDVAAGKDGSIWVSAYAQSYGDLVVAQATGGRIPTESWEWVDGVPDGPVVVPNSKIRGGIADNGPDVGMYTSIAVAPDGTPMVTYFDHDTASLKFAAKVNGTWQIHVVDQGTGTIDGAGGSLVGMYTSMTLRADDGRPGVAYLAHVGDANGGHAEVRYAAAQTPFPASASDWQTWVVDMAPLPPMDPNNPDVYPLPGGLGLFIDSARDPRNQAPVVTYYDRSAGELKLARFDPNAGQFAPAVVLDGTPGFDAGWSPSVQVDAQGVAHVAYVGATTDDLDYITDAASAQREVIDDGYRVVGQTVDGLPKPEYHFVGDDAGLVLPTGAGPMVVYQDATTQELLLAQRAMNGMWSHVSIAGATQPWPGAYGFFAADTLNGNSIVMSTWVIDQPTDDNWVEVFVKPTVIQ